MSVALELREGDVFRFSYPIHRRWHDTYTGTRGNYVSAVAIAMRRLRTKQETR